MPYIMSFYLSKVLWLIINPFNILIFLFFLNILFLFLKKNKLRIFLLSLLLILLVSFGIFPAGKYLIYKLEKNYHNSIILSDKVDGILILGGATNPFLSNEYNQIHLNGSAERLVESIKLIIKYSNAKIIFTGGSGFISDIKLDNAKIANKFFMQVGLDTDKIIFENKSRNTYENILFSKNIAKPKKNEKWLIITSASHMNRAVFVGEKIDWILTPYAVDFNQPKKIKFIPNINILNNFNEMQRGTYEWIGLVAYYLMGRTNRII